MGLLGPGAVAPKVIPGSPSSPVKSPGGDGGDERSVGSRFGRVSFLKLVISCQTSTFEN